MGKKTSPAKINLTLEILGQRADGYHDIVSIFQAISLADKLTFDWETDETQLICDHPDIPAGEENLVFKALHALEDNLRSPVKVKIFLEKNIPIGAGLGGGSSNAASVLLEAAQRYHIPSEDLHRIASSLGSDVAFFLNPGTWLGKGRGEILEKLPDFPSFPFVVVKPPFSISTRFAYSQIKRYSNGRHTALFMDSLRQKDRNKLFKSIKNDFEEALFPQYPPLATIKRKLLDFGALGAGLSGSGSALFAVARDLVHAEQIASNLKPEGQVWVVEPWK